MLLHLLLLLYYFLAVPSSAVTVIVIVFCASGVVTVAFCSSCTAFSVFMFICVVFDAPGDVGEELVRDVRNDDADGVRLAAAQGAGGVVGLVIEFLRDLQNALGRFLVHAVGLLAVGLVVHHERDQGDRNSRLRGYIFYGDSLRAHIFCDFLQYLGFSVTFAKVIKTF